jgi:outer membrane protein OmpA-like peptidoglycan-associated protein
MLVHDSKLNSRTPLKNLGVTLIESFIGANRWSLAAKFLAAKSAEEHGDKGLARLLLRQGKRKSHKDADHALIETFKLARKRGRLSVGESKQLFDLSRNKPQAELRIYFAPGSTQISPVAEPTLKKIGEALAHADMNGKAFLLASHTCRKGGVEHAAELSMARAEAVKNYLVDNFAIDADALLPQGYGFRYLKNQKNPFCLENHRFEIVNLSE